MKNLKAPFLVIALLLLNVSLVTAQDLPDPGCDEPPCGGQPPDFPINQNISFLLLGSVALGVIVIYKNQTKKASN
ncbi:hypothetical protein LPB248_13025 [Flavobacterium sp. LPB0248]|uniref:hypothetical protein n=1 Tax=Flavobacterium sp. LPB0248 TaxID=2614441 RepID=UPI0015A68053|nr:hypothetical protein [Flavobacterium sp. LPB0248]QLC67188.1 hypothetical protein LPB248_13025 [Flavobacterium sp. LPB0248]